MCSEGGGEGLEEERELQTKQRKKARRMKSAVVSMWSQHVVEL